MPTSSASIYWNICRLVEQTTGSAGDSPAPCSLRQRQLRARAYAILLDIDEDPYADVPDEARQLVNAQLALAELLRLRSQGRHGTAARLTWRLDELNDLQQLREKQHEQQGNSGAIDDSIPRLISLLLNLRGLGSTSGGSADGDGLQGSKRAIADVGTTAALLPYNTVQTYCAPRDSDEQAAGGTAATIAAFDGIPVGRRLRLQPPAGPATVVAALESAVVASSPPGTPSAPLPRRTSGASPGGGAAVATTPPNSGPATLGSLAAGAAEPLALEWFPFRDCAGLPLLPSFDAPLTDLLHQGNMERLSQLGAGAPLPRLTAGAASSGGAAVCVGSRGGGPAAPALAWTTDKQAQQRIHGGSSAVVGAAADGRTAAALAADMPSVAAPLLLGPLQPSSLVHTRFHHHSPLLMCLSGTQSECFRLPVGEAEAFAKQVAETAAADESELTAEQPGMPEEAPGIWAMMDVDGSATTAAAAGGATDGDGLPVPALPVPFALAALGVGSERQLPGSFQPPPLPSTPPSPHPQSQLAEAGGGADPEPNHNGEAAKLAVVPVPPVAVAMPGGVAARVQGQRERALTLATATSRVQPRGRPLRMRGWPQITGPLAAAGDAPASRSAAEDEELLYDMAVMALQGVASALWILRSGMIRSHRIRLASQGRVLSQLCETGELRLRLGAFAAAYGTYGTASQGGCGAQDEALAAFADAVHELLTLYDGELQDLAAWHRTGLATQPRGRAETAAPGRTCGSSEGSVWRSHTGAGVKGSLVGPLFSHDPRAYVAGDKQRPATVEEGTAAAASPSGGRRGGGLLGLLLSLAPLKVHLQRLADVCMCVPDPAWIPPHSAVATAAAAAAARGQRDSRREDGAGGAATGGAAYALPRTPPPPLAPSLWQVYGFPEGPELLDRLYGALLRTDHAKTPLLRLLFAAACAPYVRRVRAWVYDPGEGGGAGGRVGGAAVPPEAPAFTAPLQRQLTAAGLQMRLLEELGEELGDIAARFRRMAAAEAEEARLIARQYDEALAPPAPAAAAGAATGRSAGRGAQDGVLLPGLSVISGDSTGAAAGTRTGTGASRGAVSGGREAGVDADEFNYPLVFGLEALQQLTEAAAAAAAARDSELSSLLDLLERRRRAAAEAANQRVLAAAHAALAAAEAARAAKAAAAQERRMARSRLLAEQCAAMDERAARVRAERERRITEEQALAAEAVLREHNEAAAALAAELARLRASYGGASYSEGGAAGGSGSAVAAAGLLPLADERAAEAAARLRRCEWREARMALAARRRLLWQGIEAEELAQLRELVAAARSVQTAEPPAPDPSGAPPPQTQPLPPPAEDAAGGGDVPQPLPHPTAPPAALQLPSSLRLGDGVVSAQSSPVPTPRHGCAPSPSSFRALRIVAPGAGDGDGPTQAGSPRPITPRSSGRGSPVLVAHVSRPRRATYHDSGPTVEPLSPLGATAAMAADGSAAATGPSPALRARASDGGGPASRTPHHGVAISHYRPAGHLSGAKRSLSITGTATFAAASGMSPSVSVPASWRAGPEALLADPWVRAGGAQGGGGGGGGFLRPPSPVTGRHGPPRGYMPSSRGTGPRSAAGRGGTAGGLLLQLQSRHSRRRWALPQPSSAAVAEGGAALAAGPGGLTAPFFSQPLQAWGSSAAEDVEALLRRGHAEGPGASAGAGAVTPAWSTGGAVEVAADEGATDAPTFHQHQCPFSAQQPLPSADAHAVALWAAAWPASGTTASAAAACGPVESAALPADGGTGRGQQPRRRALWKVPPSAETASATINDKTSTVGVFPAASVATAPYGHPYPSVLHPFSGQQPLQVRMPLSGHHSVAGAYDSPVKALLRSYLADPRVAERVRATYSSPRRGTGHSQPRAPQLGVGQDAAATDFSGNVLAGLDTGRNVVVFGAGGGGDGSHGFGGGGGADAGTRTQGRQAALSEDLSYAPVGVSVQTCLFGSVLAQYRLTTRAVWHVLVQEYRLLQYCAALRRFFFCEAGDVAGALANSLTRRVEARPHMPPSTAELRAMLDEALAGCSLLGGSGGPGPVTRLQGSSSSRGGAGGTASQERGDAGPGSGEGLGGDDAAAAAVETSHEGGGRKGSRGDEAVAVVQRLQVRSVPRRMLGTGSYFASDVMLVTCKVPRPLDAVITPDCMRDYADVFSLLLRVRCAASALAACWSRLNAATSPLVARELGGRRPLERARGRGRVGGGEGGGRGTARVHPLWQKRLAVARLWLQAASQVVTLLRQHLHVELQGRCWAGLASGLDGSTPQDLMQMREAHLRYLACAREICMLPPSDVGVGDDAVGQPAGGPTRGITSATAAANVAPAAASAIPASRHPHQPQSHQQAQQLPGGALMDVLQCSAALATVLRRALTALDFHATASETALSAAPRQPTLSPVLSAVSRAAQTALPGGTTRPTDDPRVSGGAGGRSDVAAADLDDLWAHVVVCQTRLGQALGTLHVMLRHVGAEASGLLGEMAAVLASDPCRSFTGTAGSRLRA